MLKYLIILMLVGSGCSYPDECYVDEEQCYISEGSVNEINVFEPSLAAIITSSVSYPSGYELLPCGCHEEEYCYVDGDSFEACVSKQVEVLSCGFNCPYMGDAWSMRCK